MKPHGSCSVGLKEPAKSAMAGFGPQLLYRVDVEYGSCGKRGTGRDGVCRLYKAKLRDHLNCSPSSQLSRMPLSRYLNNIICTLL